MSALDELIKRICDFSPEQLKEFLQNEVTQSILQPEEATGSCLQEDSLCVQ